MLKHQLQRNIAILDNQIQFLKNKLSLLPEGNFYSEKAGKYLQWYMRDEKGKRYLRKKDKGKAYPLATRKYFTLLLEDLETEKDHVEDLMNLLDQKRKSSILLENPCYSDVIPKALSACNMSQYFKKSSPDNNEIVQNWLLEKYETNPREPGKRKHTAIDGTKVRSKSELIICEHLYQHNVPYRYEAAFEVSTNYYLYPDFTIMNPRTCKIFYWEHFGMIDLQGYLSNTINKLSSYNKKGVYPGENMIMTFETPDSGIDVQTVEFFINRYLV